MKKKTFAVLLPIIETLIKEDILHGIIKYTKSNDINVLFFCGSTLSPKTAYISQYNCIYSLLNTKKVDGVISVSGILFSLVQPEDMHKFLDKYGNIPIVSATLKLKNYPSITIDNGASMKELTSHLIETHNYSKIAYVTGPKLNQESIERMNGYKSALVEHRINVDESLIYYGDWSKESGYNLTDKIYIEKTKFDCLVCSNDRMAVGVYERLSELYPDDYCNYRVVGFDNSLESIIMNPPLTTSEHPMYDIGYEAAKLLNENYEETNINDQYIPCSLKIRESCGCANIMYGVEGAVLSHEKLKGQSESNSFKDNYSALIEDVVSYFYKLFEISNGKNSYEKDLKDLLDLLCEDILNHIVEGKYLNNLDRFIRKYPILLNHHKRWTTFFLKLNELLISYSTDEYVKETIYKIVYLSNALISNAKNKLTNFKGYALLDDQHKLMHYNYALSSVITQDELYTRIVNIIKVSKFNTFIVCLFESYMTREIDQDFTYPDKTQIFMSWHNNEHKKEFEKTFFKTSDMLPEFLINTNELSGYAFYPLVYRSHHFGYIIIDAVSVKANTLKSIIHEITNTIERMALYKEIETYNMQLYSLSIQDELTRLYNRRGFYTFGKKIYEKSIKDKKSLVAVYIDIDGLKKINDQHGHEKGDIAIKDLGHILINEAPNHSVVSRIGGDEYTIVVAFETVNQSENFVKNFQENMQLKLNLYNQKNNNPFKLSASIGDAVMLPDNTISFEQLLNNADKKLYENKGLKYDRRKSDQRNGDNI